MKAVVLLLAVLTIGSFSCGVDKAPARCQPGCQSKQICGSCWPGKDGKEECFRCILCKNVCDCNNAKPRSSVQSKATNLIEVQKDQTKNGTKRKVHPAQVCGRGCLPVRVCGPSSCHGPPERRICTDDVVCKETCRCGWERTK
eukprot:TRINITY_DN817_c0_g1_i3.p1 TRINITY_DN817_c0_g1~~TRINITY_DN817_c0_g1_i3.p1  ORF type:complete len:143 (-),score=14.03 TRINITY_DN817_c0_g1_i3:52-480(-)